MTCGGRNILQHSKVNAYILELLNYKSKVFMPFKYTTHIKQILGLNDNTKAREKMEILGAQWVRRSIRVINSAQKFSQIRNKKNAQSTYLVKWFNQ